VIPRPHGPRRVTDRLVGTVSVLGGVLALVVLAWILIEVVHRGVGSLSWEFFSSLPGPPASTHGGLANAMLGTLVITALALVMGVPTGILAGVYLAEYGQDTAFGAAVRYTANVLMGVPSIIVGLFAYTLLVIPFGHFSGWAGAFALALLILPVVARTTEDMLALVPNAFRESALALGAPRWRVTSGVVLRAARAGVVTGAVLALARAAGETAPLLFTALNSPYWPRSLSGPTANLTVTIFNYAMSPYEHWQRMAWGASLVITVVILLLNALARAFSKEARP
jgi:phosphate transport system permease protein